jgi:hypothetical protein
MLPIMHGKKVAQAILGGGHDEGPEEAPADEGLHAAMEEFIQAVKEGDVAGAVEAFKACSDQCEGSEGEEESQ